MPNLRKNNTNIWKWSLVFAKNLKHQRGMNTLYHIKNCKRSITYVQGRLETHFLMFSAKSLINVVHVFFTYMNVHYITDKVSLAPFTTTDIIFWNCALLRNIGIPLTLDHYLFRQMDVNLGLCILITIEFIDKLRSTQLQCRLK